jgi:phosphopantetheinyl transferase (holo-ACP synthase)
VTQGPAPAGGDLAVGNDVVDLEDAEARLDGLHPRFEQRVFTEAERAALAGSPCRLRLHWALWAAKESAYKALKQLDPALVFSPRELEVALDPGARGGPRARDLVTGRVVRGSLGLDVQIRFCGESVHAIARSRASGPARFLSTVEAAREDAGVAVRRLAASAIGATLGLEPAELRISGRPPLVLRGGERLDLSLSLSHHGRFVAFAAALRPGTPAAQRAAGHFAGSAPFARVAIA